MLDIIIYSVCFFVLLYASISDIRTREVPDWLSYSAIIAGLLIRLIASLIYSDWSHMIDGLIGFGMFLVIGVLMFYSGLWGGGDSKILMGLGALLGLRFEFLPFIVIFFIATLFAGALYGFFYSLVLALLHKRKFVRSFRYIVNHKTSMIIRKFLAILLVFSLLYYFLTFNSSSIHINFLYAFSLFLLFLVFFLWIFSKAVEKSCMEKYVDPEKLTEGDWIVNDVLVGGKRICGPKDLGISLEQIGHLIKLKHKKKIKKVLIKEGIPFIPAFFLGFIVTLILQEKIIFWISMLF